VSALGQLAANATNHRDVRLDSAVCSIAIHQSARPITIAAGVVPL